MVSKTELNLGMRQPAYMSPTCRPRPRIYIGFSLVLAYFRRI